MGNVLGYLRKVVGDYTFRKSSCPLNGCTRVLRLECGHEVSRKGSQPVPKRAHCLECDRAALSDRLVEP